MTVIPVTHGPSTGLFIILHRRSVAATRQTQHPGETPQTCLSLSLCHNFKPCALAGQCHPCTGARSSPFISKYSKVENTWNPFIKMIPLCSTRGSGTLLTRCLHKLLNPNSRHHSWSLCLYTEKDWNTTRKPKTAIISFCPHFFSSFYILCWLSARLLLISIKLSFSQLQVVAPYCSHAVSYRCRPAAGAVWVCGKTKQASGS